MIRKTYEVVLDSIHRDRETLARSPPGTSAGGSLQIPSYFQRQFTGRETHLETSRAPIDELNSPLCLDVADGSVDVLGDDVSSVQ
jgi:hypothetical protein